MGFWVCIFITLDNTAIGVYSLTTGERVGGYYDAWALVDGGFFAFISWGLWRNSRVWASIGLALWAAEIIDKLKNAESTFGVIAVLLFLAILNATRGTFAFHKYSIQESERNPAKNRPAPSGIKRQFFSPYKLSGAHLQEAMRNKSDQELRCILESRSGEFTEDATKAAEIEAKLRNLNPHETDHDTPAQITEDKKRLVTSNAWSVISIISLLMAFSNASKNVATGPGEFIPVLIGGFIVSIRATALFPSNLPCAEVEGWTQAEWFE